VERFAERVERRLEEMADRIENDARGIQPHVRLSVFRLLRHGYGGVKARGQAEETRRSRVRPGPEKGLR
jgi:hypothetical protein